MSDLLNIKFRSKDDTEEKLIKNENVKNENDTECDDETETKMFAIAQFFLFSSIEAINASFVNNKINENVRKLQLLINKFCVCFF